MKDNLFITILLLSFFILRGGVLLSQTTVQVVTKRVEKTFVFKIDDVLNIDGERAEIVINTLPNISEVKITMELIAKHPQLDIAKNDLKNLQFMAEKDGKDIFLRNYISINKGDNKPLSDLKARYVITLPVNANLSVKNNFGKISIKAVQGKVHLSTEFCKINLTDVKGVLTLKARFSDIEAMGLEGNVAIETNRSDITIAMTGGNCDLRAMYGKIKASTNDNVIRLSISADKAAVIFYPPSARAVVYDMEAEYGKIILPKSWSVKYLEKSSKLEKVNFRHNPINHKSNIIPLQVLIKTSFSDIDLNNKP